MSASVFYEDKLSFWVFLKKLKFILTIFENFRAAGQFCLKWNVTKCSKLENIAIKNAFFWYYINIQTFFCLFICCNCVSAMCHLFWNPESKNNKKIRYTCKFFYCIDMLFRSLMAMKQTLGGLSNFQQQLYQTYVVTDHLTQLKATVGKFYICIPSPPNDKWALEIF